MSSSRTPAFQFLSCFFLASDLGRVSPLINGGQNSLGVSVVAARQQGTDLTKKVGGKKKDKNVDGHFLPEQNDPEDSEKHLESFFSNNICTCVFKTVKIKTILN